MIEKPLEDVAVSVQRLNDALGSKMLPEEALRTIALAADKSTTFRELVSTTPEHFPEDKTERYAMFVRFANAFWNTAKDVPVRIDSGSGEVIAGEERGPVLALHEADNRATLKSIHYTVSKGYLEAVNAALNDCKTGDDALPGNFRNAAERVTSGSFEGYQLVTNVADTIITTHQQVEGVLLEPGQLQRELAAQFTQVKKIMKLNIIGDEFLDALMYGDVRLFTCKKKEEAKDGESKYEVVFRPEVVNALEEVGENYCKGMREGITNEGFIPLFRDIHGTLAKHLGKEDDMGDEDKLSDDFEQACYDIQEMLLADDQNPSIIRILQVMERTMFQRMAKLPLDQWPHDQKLFFMDIMMMKSVTAWHTEPNLRMISSCPMLYSRVLLPWYEKVCEPIRDWYEQALEKQK